jgi:hypothetical protein
MDQNHVERLRLGRRCIDHALEFRAAVIGCGDAGLHVIGDDLHPRDSQ